MRQDLQDWTRIYGIWQDLRCVLKNHVHLWPSCKSYFYFYEGECRHQGPNADRIPTNAIHLEPDSRRQRILVAPLNWGLGHVARCVPLIQALGSTFGGRGFVGIRRRGFAFAAGRIPAFAHVRVAMVAASDMTHITWCGISPGSCLVLCGQCERSRRQPSNWSRNTGFMASFRTTATAVFRSKPTA